MSAALLARATMYAGIVGWFGVPSWPIAVASPATLFTTSVAMAPAVSALRILTEKVQVPREISAIFAGEAAARASAVQALLSAGAVEDDAERRREIGLDTVAKSPATPA